MSVESFRRVIPGTWAGIILPPFIQGVIVRRPLRARLTARVLNRVARWLDIDRVPHPTARWTVAVQLLGGTEAPRILGEVDAPGEAPALFARFSEAVRRGDDPVLQPWRWGVV
jgi:hypothetical protein